MRPSLCCVLPLLLITTATAQEPSTDSKFLTTPERTNWEKTSTSQDVRSLLAALTKAHPDAFTVSSLGTSLRGRPIQVATVLRDPKESFDERLRVVVIANIHGGEVEGKEAVQILLREIALGRHKDILEHCDLWLVPIYNVDGNDEIQPGNRASQNGPDAVGTRRNTQNLDLNRDVVKVETPETRALLGLFRRVDPHFFMDLHTTNGSPHGYHLTYAPSLSTNQDPDLDGFMHEDLVPKIRAGMLKNHSFRVFDYGNFGRRGQPTSWTTYAHTPRYAINYAGLRNRLSLLSEAYSYLPFKQRAAVTRAFVLESLRALVKRREKVFELCKAADRRTREGKYALGYNSRLRNPVRRNILVGETRREGRRYIAGKEYREVEMDVRVRFQSDAHLVAPAAWAIAAPSDAVRKALLIHGVEVHRLKAPVEVVCERFAVTSRSRGRMRYEGHTLVQLAGELKSGKTTLPKGSLIIPARQRLGRVATQLLDGHSEDSLATWNFFDKALSGDEPTYPVLRITRLPDWKLEREVMRHDDQVVAANYRPAPKQLANRVRVTITVTRPGRRTGGRGYESNARYVDREVVYGIGPQKFTDIGKLQSAVADAMKNLSTRSWPILLEPGNGVTNGELDRIAALVRKAGATQVFLKREPE